MHEAGSGVVRASAPSRPGPSLPHSRQSRARSARAIRRRPAPRHRPRVPKAATATSDVAAIINCRPCSRCPELGPPPSRSCPRCNAPRIQTAETCAVNALSRSSSSCSRSISSKLGSLETARSCKMRDKAAPTPPPNAARRARAGSTASCAANTGSVSSRQRHPIRAIPAHRLPRTTKVELVDHRQMRNVMSIVHRFLPRSARRQQDTRDRPLRTQAQRTRDTSPFHHHQQPAPSVPASREPRATFW